MPTINVRELGTLTRAESLLFTDFVVKQPMES